MNVWVLIEVGGYDEGDDIRGVYSSASLAKAAVPWETWEPLMGGACDEWSAPGYYIETFAVDDPAHAWFLAERQRELDEAVERRKAELVERERLSRMWWQFPDLDGCKCGLQRVLSWNTHEGTATLACGCGRSDSAKGVLVEAMEQNSPPPGFVVHVAAPMGTIRS